jgi:flagellar biosynthetic protein FlhB
MAEDSDGASKTEEPTQRKLDQAREKGDVVKTPDLPQLAALAASGAVVFICGGWMSRNLAEALQPFLANAGTMSVEGGAGVQIARRALMAAAPILLAVMLTTAAAGAAGNLVQTGLMFSAEKLKLDFNKVSPIAGFKKLFGIDALMQWAKSIVKIAVVAWIAWLVLKPHVHDFQTMSAMDITGILPYSADIIRRLVFAVVIAMIVIAGFDWFWQRQRFQARMRMTKEEIKEDYKQSDGDPHVKARQRQLRMERARRRMMQAVPDATLVVMNPTHYAVALKYEPGETAAPLCVAKGMDAIALKIRAIAEASGVPIIEDPPLARALFASVEIDDIIPPGHYEAVAKIIGFIMNGRRPAAKGSVN